MQLYILMGQWDVHGTQGLGWGGGYNKTSTLKTMDLGLNSEA